jgi:hypothetical protein
MRDIDHRPKSMLGIVAAIAHQTATRQLPHFEPSLPI